MIGTEEQEEIKYLRRQLQEAVDVIAQLHIGFPIPGRPIFIHPLDLAAMLESRVVNFMDVIKDSSQVADYNLIKVDGITYRQSTFMPKNTQRFS